MSERETRRRRVDSETSIISESPHQGAWALLTRSFRSLAECLKGKRMDLVATCKDKLSHFRVKELKDVLTHLGLSKQGRKQDLVDRILAVLSDEQGSGAKINDVRKDEVVKLIDDTYRKMKVSGAADLASKSQGLSDSANVKFKEEIVNSYQMDKARCICGSPLPTDSMIKCEDPRCNVRQHVACVVIPEKPMEGVSLNPPEIYYCETCRLSRADPFWTTVAQPLYPVKLSITNVPADGSNPGLSIERLFKLTKADKDLLSKQDYDLQAWCMLLNDKVTFRMQWPQYADLQVNGVSVRAINRPGSQLLGANGRDDGPIITHCTRDGINKISLTGCDSRIFCVGVRIVKRRTLHQILSLIPKETEGESFEDALTRVRKCIGGGATTENAVSDSDIEIVADFIPVNLRCPMSGLRLKVAGRFQLCAHMGCFDLEVFVEMNQRSRKWQCPICLKNYSWETIIIDPYFNRITSKLCNSGDDVAEIEVKPDGSWRVKAEVDRRRGLGDLALWHLPDGTLCDTSEVESKPKSELKPTIQEVDGDSHDDLKLGIKKNQNGSREFNKSGDMKIISPTNRFHETLNSCGPHIIPMSSSATGSGRDGEDTSVNQDGIEYESKSLIIDLPPGFNDPTTVPARDAVVIVLSDSEEETELLVSSEAIYNNVVPATSGIRSSASQSRTVDSYYENPALVSGDHLYNPNDDDEFGSSMWSLPSGGEGVPSLPLFGSDVEISDPLVDVHGTVPAAQYSNENDGSGDTHLAFSGQDQPLQIFLPTRLSGAATEKSGPGDHPEALNGMRTEDWFSLNLGDSCARNQGESAAGNASSSGRVLQSKDGALDSLAGHATISLGMNDSGNCKKSRVRSDSPSSFPNQERSVKPRIYLSIDSD